MSALVILSEFITEYYRFFLLDYLIQYNLLHTSYLRSFQAEGDAHCIYLHLFHKSEVLLFMPKFVILVPI